MIPNFTIYSDKIFLTANYYTEYLGFNLLHKFEELDNPYVWLELNGQFLLIWPWEKKLGTPRPVELEVPDIHSYYSYLIEHTRINKPLFTDKDGRYLFSILDCEDNIIQFKEQTSASVNITEDLNSIELAFERKNI